MFIGLMSITHSAIARPQTSDRTQKPPNRLRQKQKTNNGNCDEDQLVCI